MTNLSEINLGPSDFHALQSELEQKSRMFDYFIELDAECERARILYIEIKELRYRIRELSEQEGTDLVK
jgi:hypothetical protein